VAALFGVAAVQSSVATGDATVADLIAQVNALGPLNSTDLIVITSGAADFAARAGAGGTNAAATAYLNSLKIALNTLKNKGATHILLTTVVDTSVNPDPDVVTFNLIVSAGLGDYASVARLTNINRPAVSFPNWATNTNTPYCGAGLVGCNLGVANPDLYFLADTINPTPIANRWIAQYLFDVTAQGWR
jgi:phospholipase/lecithinase/hemolysin